MLRGGLRVEQQTFLQRQQRQRMAKRTVTRMQLLQQRVIDAFQRHLGGHQRVGGVLRLLLSQRDQRLRGSRHCLM